MSTPISQSNREGSQLGMDRQSLGQPIGQPRGEMQQHSEGPVARTLEQQTAKLPSDMFLWAAVGSIGASAVLQLMGKKNARLFVGEWVSQFLQLVVYNKIVKLAGSDKYDRPH